MQMVQYIYPWKDLLTIIYGCIHENQGNHWSNPGRQCWVEDLADCIVQHVRRIKSDVSGRYFCKFNKVCLIIMRLIWFCKILRINIVRLQLILTNAFGAVSCRCSIFLVSARAAPWRLRFHKLRNIQAPWYEKYRRYVNCNPFRTFHRPCYVPISTYNFNFNIHMWLRFYVTFISDKNIFTTCRKLVGRLLDTAQL